MTKSGSAGRDAPTRMAVFQTVSLQPNSDWTDSLATAIERWKSNQKKTISVNGKPVAQTSDASA